MKDFDNILTDEQYSTLQQEYYKVSHPQNNCCLDLLNSIIATLETNGFMMPLKIQNQILNTLYGAQQILSILYNNFSFKPLNTSNNPFQLIYHLSQLSNLLTNIHKFKSPYYILNIKANQYIIKCISDISQYFIAK